MGNEESPDDYPFSPLVEQSNVNNAPETIAVDEFLYQDARDRETRIRMRNQLIKEDILAVASKKKINSLSTVMLKKKAV